MCQADSCGVTDGKIHDGYRRAYAESESVRIRLILPCPKCTTWITVEDNIHHGGEQWHPIVKCEKCGTAQFPVVKPITAFLRRRT